MNIKKALVVDDSKVAHLTLRKLLLERGIEVDWVGSGEDCIKYLDAKTPDIVFMDVMMPGMDGFETSRAVTGRQTQSSPPIIMCSANATDEDKRDAKESGAVGFLSKPYTPSQLDDVLESVSVGTAAITLEEPATPPKPVITPSFPRVEPVVSEPRVTAPTVPPMPTAPALTAAEIEQIAERAAWGAAEKVARDIVQELVPNLAREAAAQTARNISEDLGRRAAHAAVRAAQEAAKQAATEIARGTAERTARSTAQESARVVAEQAAREVSEGVSQRNIARGLEINREELVQHIEEQVNRQIKENLILITTGQDFKQQITQMVRTGIQPVVEGSAQQAAERAVQQSAPALIAQAGGPALSRANLALALSMVAVLAAVAALAGSILKLF